MNQVSIVDELHKLDKPFKDQNKYDLAFNSECLFAKQQIIKNDFTLKTAQNNPGSLRSAILNVAAIGISLNPASAHAYLVPRDGMICLDISYRGLVKLATDTGAIEWAKAVLVYEGDEFKWRGPSEAPLHEADVFAEGRIDADDPLKNLKGGYCIAKLKDGYMVEVMTAGEIIAVKQSSKALKGPWAGKWAGEMAKKTLVKRAYKSWPQSGGRERLDEAINILNQHEGIVETHNNDVSEYLHHSPEQGETFHNFLKDGDPMDYYLWYSALDYRVQTSLFHSFEAGGKGKGRELALSMNDKGRDQFDTYRTMLIEACEAEDEVGAREVLNDVSESQYTALVDSLSIELVRFANSIKDQSL